MSPLAAGSPGVDDFLKTPLNFGDPNAYGGEAYKDIPTEFNIDPGVGRRTDLAEQEVGNRWNSAFMSGVPAYIREANRAKELRGVQAQGAGERQQAEYGRQQLQNQALTTRAQMRDQGELARANIGNSIAGQTTAAELERRRQLLPQLVQTGGNSSGSGYNTQIQPGQQGWFGSLLQGAGSAIGGLGAGGYL
jgi:hypothetical protein